MITLEIEAYALGYYDGRAYGNQNRPRFENEKANLFYKLGYDRGVADFCEYDMENLEIEL
jgi:hypothetical protein